MMLACSGDWKRTAEVVLLKVSSTSFCNSFVVYLKSDISLMPPRAVLQLPSSTSASSTSGICSNPSAPGPEGAARSCRILQQDDRLTPPPLGKAPPLALHRPATKQVSKQLPTSACLTTRHNNPNLSDTRDAFRLQPLYLAPPMPPRDS